MIKQYKKQKGFALVTSLMLLLIMTVMGIAMTARSNLNTNMSVSYGRSEHVLFAAEAGIEHARRYLENSSSLAPPVYPVNTNPPTTTSGLLNTVPLNRCLADFQDGIGGAANQYDTLGINAGRFAYRFPQNQNGITLQVVRGCNNINANPNLEENYRRMDCELDLANDPSSNANEIDYFRTFGFSYYIFYEGESSGAATSTTTGVGNVGSTTSYSAGSQDIAYYYKVISCGAEFTWNGANNTANLNQIQTLEARIKLQR